MKANELRIGNLAQIKGEKLIMDIKITAWDIYTTSIGWGSYEPYELTDDWLIRFGFELYSESNEINIEIAKKHPLYLRLMANEWTLFVREGGGAFKTIKYVHELQNLYFSLTGSDLVLADA